MSPTANTPSSDKSFSAGWPGSKSAGKTDDWPRRVRHSEPRPGSVRREQQRHLASSYRCRGLKFPLVADFDLEWKYPPGTETAQKLLDHIIEKYAILPKGSTVDYLNAGDFNRVFLVQAPRDFEEASGERLPALILRIPMPLDPFYSMESGVATMEFARQAGLPVPKVYWFDSSAKNPLGMEWMLMEFVEDGQTLSSHDWDEKDPAKIISREIMAHLDRLSEQTFDKIGSLYCNWDTREFYVGPVATYEHIRGPRVHYDNRGPFSTLEEYFAASIENHLRDIDNPDLPDSQFFFSTSKRCRRKGEEHGQRRCICRVHVREAFRQLALKVRDDLLPPFLKLVKETNGAERRLLGPFSGYFSRLWHTDLHQNNLLVTEGKGIAAFLDWEGQLVAPRCLSLPVPKFALHYPFDQEDLTYVPNAEAYGPSLEDILAGNAKKISLGSAFVSKDCTSPVAVALLAVQLKIERLHVIDEVGEWIDDACKFLNPGKHYEDNRDSDDSSGEGSGSRGEGGTDSEETNSSRPVTSPPDSSHGSGPSGKSKMAGTDDRQQQNDHLADSEEQQCSPSQVSPASEAQSPPPSQVAPVSGPPRQEKPPQPFDSPDLEDVDLGPPPPLDVRLLPYNGQQVMSIPLVDLMGPYQNNDRLNREIPSTAAGGPANAIVTINQPPPVPTFIFSGGAFLRLFCCL